MSETPSPKEKKLGQQGSNPVEQKVERTRLSQGNEQLVNFVGKTIKDGDPHRPRLERLPKKKGATFQKSPRQKNPKDAVLHHMDHFVQEPDFYVRRKGKRKRGKSKDKPRI